jgi:hypothetical protein
LPENTYGAAVKFCGVAEQHGMPCGQSCRMSLLFCLEGKGAWLMLGLQGGSPENTYGAAVKFRGVCFFLFPRRCRTAQHALRPVLPDEPAFLPGG